MNKNAPQNISLPDAEVSLGLIVISDDLTTVIMDPWRPFAPLDARKREGVTADR